jgi:cell division protein ZapA
MGQVSVTINKKTYRMACADGQENRIRELADHFSAHVERLKTSFQRVHDDHLYLMAALLIADEYFEAREELLSILAQLARLGTKDAGSGDNGAKSDKELARMANEAVARLSDLRNAARKAKTPGARTGTADA